MTTQEKVREQIRETMMDHKVGVLEIEVGLDRIMGFVFIHGELCPPDPKKDRNDGKQSS